jgi:hypothetical protein
MSKYELWIGEFVDFAGNKLPIRKLIITEEQLAIIEQFSSTRKDSELNTIYKLNDCEFSIMPVFKPNTDSQELPSDLKKAMDRLSKSFGLTKP